MASTPPRSSGPKVVLRGGLWYDDRVNMQGEARTVESTTPLVEIPASSSVSIPRACSLPGRLPAMPAITSVKNTAIEIAVPEFWKVARIPDATPRSEAGTLLRARPRR